MHRTHRTRFWHEFRVWTCWDQPSWCRQALNRGLLTCGQVAVRAASLSVCLPPIRPRFIWVLKHHQGPWISMNRLKPELLSPK